METIYCMYGFGSAHTIHTDKEMCVLLEAASGGNDGYDTARHPILFLVCATVARQPKWRIKSAAKDWDPA